MATKPTTDLPATKNPTTLYPTDVHFGSGPTDTPRPNTTPNAPRKTNKAPVL